MHVIALAPEINGLNSVHVPCSVSLDYSLGSIITLVSLSYLMLNFWCISFM